MKRSLKRLFLLALAAVLCVLPGCKPGEPGEGGGGGSSGTQYGVHEAKITPTDTVLYRGGESDYAIVLPQNDTVNEQTAANELQLHLKNALGYTFPIVRDTDVGYTAEGRYISVGDTRLFQEAGIVVNFTRLKSSGYQILTKGKTIFLIADPTGYGIIYSVYGLLEDMIDFHAYATSELQFDSPEEILLQNYEITEIPAIDKCLVTNAAYSQPEQLYRLRMQSREFKYSFPYGISHSLSNYILPYSVYGKDHPDWYGGPQKSQVCLTNLEMQAELVRVLEKKLAESEIYTNVFLGLNDDHEKCMCGNCQDAREKYGPQESALLIRMINRVSEEVDRWLLERGDARKVTYATYAYHTSLEPPVKKLEDGSYVPNDPSVVPNDNVAVMFTPIDAMFNVSYKDKANEVYYEQLQAWSSLCKNMWSYTYGVNYENFFVQLNNIGVLQDNYLIMAEAGVSCSFIQGNDGGNAHFRDLREYLISQLAWDPYQDLDALINEFMSAYYRDAAALMREYYDLLRVHYAYLESEMDVHGGIYYIHEAKHWPKNLLNQIKDIFDRAYALIEPLRSSDFALYDLIESRLRRESLAYRYLELDFYSSFDSSTSLSRKIDSFEADCSEFGIVWYKEYYYVKDIVDEWRARL